MDRLTDLDPLLPAEAHLLAACSTPDRVVIGDGTLPAGKDDSRTIRADFMRILLTSPDSALHAKGLRLRGACIAGVLDLQGVRCKYNITLRSCRLTDPVNLVNARLQGLHLSDVAASGLSAENARLDGSLFLRDGTRIEGEVSLAGARISGDLQICGAELLSQGQDALFAPTLQVDGSVFLGNYPYGEGITTLVARGTLFLSSARVGHDVFISNTAISLNPERVTGLVFGATEEHGSDMALSLGRARIGGILSFQDNQIGQGIVNLAGATVARFKDEPSGPGANYPIRLDGFRYGDVSRHANMHLEARLHWLERRPANTPFTTQPYEQLASVLSALGHSDDARTVLMRKERMLRRENRATLVERWGFGPRLALAVVADWVLRATVGYGYRPGRSIVMAIALIVALGLFFEKTWAAGDMAPNAAPILTSAPWIAATQTHPDNPAAYWSGIGQAGQDWETFNGFAYAADLVIPLVSLGQESAWAPSTSRSEWGRAGWWIRWFAKGIGWVIAALVASAITGVIRQD